MGGQVRPHVSPRCPCRSSSALTEVAQLSFEIASFSSLSGTQPIAWQLEYPRAGASGSAVSELFVSQQDLVAIVPLATVSLAGVGAARALPVGRRRAAARVARGFPGPAFLAAAERRTGWACPAGASPGAAHRWGAGGQRPRGAGMLP